MLESVIQKVASAGKSSRKGQGGGVKRRRRRTRAPDKKKKRTRAPDDVHIILVCRSGVDEGGGNHACPDSDGPRGARCLERLARHLHMPHVDTLEALPLFAIPVERIDEERATVSAILRASAIVLHEEEISLTHGENG